MVIDIGALRTSGYRVADWLRQQHHIDVHLADHRRISAQLTHADDASTTGALLTALRDLAEHADHLRPVPEVAVPPPEDLRMEQTRLPRDAYFGSFVDVPPQRAAGRIAAEMITPYPPGIPAVLPGELLKEPVLDYLRTGVEAGMNLPDAADPTLSTVRVLVEESHAD
jgi:arginine decarboxylase